MRSRGRVRFLTVSRRFQLTCVGALATGMLAWLAISSVMLVSQYRTHQTELAVNAKAQRIARTAEAVQNYRGSVEDRAERLAVRQDALEGLAERYFGELPAIESTTEALQREDGAASAVPGMRGLMNMEIRQLAFAEAVTDVAEARSARAEKLIAGLGLKSARLLRGTSAQGGPFVPFGNRQPEPSDEIFAAMAEAMDRMERLESALLEVPSFAPAKAMSLTSKFGLRRDPFSGRAAMHLGQDFRGRHGEPILAAAPGRIVRATRSRGYGKIVVVDHGRGIRTRYAHLSSIAVKPGERVARGAKLGGMGSTGRSTGTHLHFEVRVDGKAVDPRPFLEANSHVLEIQNLAAGRGGTSGTADAG